jgi:proteasome lid subunit RPN8/RPN11
MAADDDISVRFALPGAQWALSFDGEVVRHLDRHAQRRWYQRESVGQLFTSDLTEPIIRIDLATLLKAKRSSTSSVTFDTDEAMKQRADQFTAGRYCVGMWHTHPEPLPEPSGVDAQLAMEHARAAQPVLNGLVFVIVGNRRFPESWNVSIHDRRHFRRALPPPRPAASTPRD